MTGCKRRFDSLGAFGLHARGLVALEHLGIAPLPCVHLWGGFRLMQHSKSLHVPF